MTSFRDKLDSKSFLVTAEMTPPKGVNIEQNLSLLDSLAPVDAVNVTDQNASVMRLGPLPLGKVILDRGIEPICQFTCRDRNRIALQSDLLGANVLGIHNILCLTGDPTGTGDHPDAKPVFDLSVIELLRAATQMESGVDMAGNPLNGTPTFCLGAAANPGAPDVDVEVGRMEQKGPGRRPILSDPGRLRPRSVCPLHGQGPLSQCAYPCRNPRPALGPSSPLPQRQRARHRSAPGPDRRNGHRREQA